MIELTVSISLGNALTDNLARDLGSTLDTINLAQVRSRV